MNKYGGLPHLAVVLMLASSMTLVGCDDKAHQQVASAPQKVGVVTLQAGTLNITTELPGRTSAYRVAEVRPQVGGIILKRQFVEGSEITAGESLYQIDPAPYKAAFDVTKGDLSKAQASAEIANLTLKRYKTLLSTNYISRQDYDRAVATARQANAAVESAKAALETARINLFYTKVSSPISGRIGQSNITEGALVTAGQPNTLATVQQLDPIYVDVTQSSTDLLRLKREMAAGTLKQLNGKASVELKLEDGTTYPQKGTLEFSDVSVDETTGSVTLRAIFPNPDKLLLPGMFVRANLNEGVKQGAILVPQRGITRNPRGEATALVVNQENKVELRVIKVSQAIEDKWLVTEGLQAGDKVIVTGLMRLRPGAPVTAEEHKDEPLGTAQNATSSSAPSK